MAVGEEVVGATTSAFPTTLAALKVQSTAKDPASEDPTKAEGRDANAWSAEIQAIQGVLGASARGLVVVDPAVPDCDIGGFRTMDGGSLVSYAGESALALTGGAVNYIYLDLTAGPPAGAAAASWPVTPHIPLWVWDDSGGSPVETDARLHLAGASLPQSHADSHIKGGTDEIDGDHIDIDLTPTYYTPSTTPAEASDADHLAAHLAGIDLLLAGVLGDSWQTVRFDAVTLAATVSDDLQVSAVDWKLVPGGDENLFGFYIAHATQSGSSTVSYWVRSFGGAYLSGVPSVGTEQDIAILSGHSGAGVILTTASGSPKGFKMTATGQSSGASLTFHVYALYKLHSN